MANYGGDINNQLLVFTVEGVKHALYLSSVDTVEFAVELSPLPEAPPAILGTINWRGQILPVMSMRRRLHVPDRRVEKSDRLVIVKYSKRRMALLVDDVIGLFQAKPTDVTVADSVADGLGCVTGFVPIEDGILNINDSNLFLSEAEEQLLGAP